ncbi:hypothetical protein POV27_14875 [Aureisphaera galaxeae]|uniref:hypothetical protein n=1 Tax=Aureisphaera galaxeae TaxID=1538023 RepID=UPI002350FFBC|nr:hypothetical protein [Aureisphaera galaxeae]MDC8005344.1 hypothetical protein [Aureisphaera galaxeae]
MDCDVNEYFTAEFTGNYVVSNDDIDFMQQTSEVIENPNDDQVEFSNPNIRSSKILELTEVSLTIEIIEANQTTGGPDITFIYEFEN